MKYAYLLDKDEIVNRDYSRFVKGIERIYEYPPTEELSNFNDNLSKVALLLTTSEKCVNSTISFDSGDMDLYSQMGRTIYHCCTDIQRQEMKDSFYEILIEQSIVAIISSWECYFYDILERVFNDDQYVAKLASDSDTFDKFTNVFNIRKDYDNLSTSNGDSTINLKLGTLFLNKKRISCQDTDHVKDLFKILFNIEITNIDQRSWNSIYNMFQDRHSIIHNKKDEMRAEYSKEKIEKIANSIYKIIGYVDERLFTIVYD